VTSDRAVCNAEGGEIAALEPQQPSLDCMVDEQA
jgi:hypothetical protein